MKMIINDQ